MLSYTAKGRNGYTFPYKKHNEMLVLRGFGTGRQRHKKKAALRQPFYKTRYP